MRSSTRRLAVRGEARLKILRLGRGPYYRSAPVSASKTMVERERKGPHALSICFESCCYYFPVSVWIVFRLSTRLVQYPVC